MKTETEQLKHRLSMVNDDLAVIRRFIYEKNLAKEFEQPTIHSDEAWTHLNNIEIACDLSSDEALSWRNFTLQDVDGETMEETIRGFGMRDKMLKQFVLKMPLETIYELLEEKITLLKTNP